MFEIVDEDTPVTATDISDRELQNLAVAVISQAIRDYVNGGFHHELRYGGNGHGYEAAKFFFSNDPGYPEMREFWFQCSGLDLSIILTVIQDWKSRGVKLNRNSKYGKRYVGRD